MRSAGLFSIPAYGDSGVPLKGSAAEPPEVLEVVLPEGHAGGELVEPPRLHDVSGELQVVGGRTGDELSEVCGPRTGLVGEDVKENPGENRF